MTAGQPPKFKTVKEMQSKIDEYFDYCDNRIQHVYNAKAGGVIEIINPAPYTIMGLSRVLKCTRQTLLNYEKEKGYEKFFDTVKEAKAKIAEDVETRSIESAAAGPIFNLKNNFGYKDSQEITGDGNAPLAIRLTKSDEGL